MRLRAPEKYAIAISGALGVVLLSMVLIGTLALTKFAEIVAGIFATGIAAALGWGFKSRFTHPEAVEKSVKSTKRKQIAETVQIEDQQELTNHTKKLRIDEADEYVFKVHKGDRITGKISADGAFGAFFLTASSRRSFNEGNDFNAIEGIDDAYAYSATFEAPRAATYYLIIENQDKKNIKIQVNLTLVHR